MWFRHFQIVDNARDDKSATKEAARAVQVAEGGRSGYSRKSVDPAGTNPAEIAGEFNRFIVTELCSFFAAMFTISTEIFTYLYFLNFKAAVALAEVASAAAMDNAVEAKRDKRKARFEAAESEATKALVSAASAAAAAAIAPPPISADAEVHGTTTLVEIGPRFVLQIVKIFSGSFGGATLYANHAYETPNHARSVELKRKGDRYKRRQHAKVGFSL